MIQLVMEIWLALLFMQCSMVKNTEIDDASREELFIPALRGLIKDVPEESWTRNFEHGRFDHIQGSNDITKRMFYEMLTKENKDHLKRLFQEYLPEEFLLNAPESTIRDIRASSSCKIGLGGHCLTEEMDKAASAYHYLKGPSSPGKKRRAAL